MAYGGFENLPTKPAADKVLHDKAFNIAQIQNMVNIKEILRQWFKSFLIKRLCVVLLKIKSCKIRN